MRPSPLTRQESGMVHEVKEGSWTTDQDKYNRLDLSTVPWSTTGPLVYMTNPSRLVEFDSNQVNFSEPLKMAYGGYKINVTYGTGGDELVFQTPPMCLPFGLTVFNNKRGKSKILELDFYHRKFMPKVMQFFEACRALDYVCLQACIKNRDTWLPGLKKSQCKDEEIWKKYCAITRMREAKGGQVYDPRFTTKVWNSSVMFDRLEAGQVQDEEEDTIPITQESIEKKSWVVLQAVCTGMWVSQGSISPGFRLTQGRLVDAPKGSDLPRSHAKMKPTILF